MGRVGWPAREKAAVFVARSQRSWLRGVLISYLRNSRCWPDLFFPQFTYVYGKITKRLLQTGTQVLRAKKKRGKNAQSPDLPEVPTFRTKKPVLTPKPKREPLKFKIN